MRYLIFLFVLLCGCDNADSKIDVIKRFDYAGYGSFGLSLTETGDGGALICATTNAFGGSDAYLIRIDNHNNKMWENVYGDENVNQGYEVVQTGDGGFVVAGITNLGGTNRGNQWVFKIDSLGSLMWEKVLFPNNAGKATGLIKVDDGIIVCGDIESTPYGHTDISVVKCSDSGNVVWSKTFDVKDYDRGIDIKQLIDNSFLICGESLLGNPLNSDSGTGFSLIKIDINGNTLWIKKLGKTGEDAKRILELSNNTIVILGTNYIKDPYGDIWLAYFDESGNLICDSTYESPYEDQLFDAVLSSQDHVVFCGLEHFETKNNEYVNGYGFIKTINEKGKIIESVKYGKSGDTIIYSVATQGAGLIACGNSINRTLFLRL